MSDFAMTRLSRYSHEMANDNGVYRFADVIAADDKEFETRIWNLGIDYVALASMK